ncbi:MAG: SymE family type I addiction module toxin [Spirosomataceae bacterium]
MKRILKVSKKGRINVLRRVKWVPELKLSGHWLAQAGIEAGSWVEIEVLQNQIIIHHG